MKTMLFVIAIVVMGAGLARAQAPGETPAADPPPRVERYGKTIAAVDVAAVALIVIGGVEINEHGDESWGPFAVGAGILTYAVGGAVVHGRHHRGGAAAKSLAMRTLFPVVGAGVLGLAGSPLNDREIPIGTMLGVAAGTLLGAATAMAIDWFSLAKERQVTATVQPTGGGATVGLAGSF
jgi:hypothetical protein